MTFAGNKKIPSRGSAVDITIVIIVNGREISTNYKQNKTI